MCRASCPAVGPAPGSRDPCRVSARGAPWIRHRQLRRVYVRCCPAMAAARGATRDKRTTGSFIGFVGVGALHPAALEAARRLRPEGHPHPQRGLNSAVPTEQLRRSPASDSTGRVRQNIGVGTLPPPGPPDRVHGPRRAGGRPSRLRARGVAARELLPVPAGLARPLYARFRVADASPGHEPARAVPGCLPGTFDSAIGITTEKVVPLSRALSTEMRPPCASTSRRTMYRPSPSPAFCCAGPTR